MVPEVEDVILRKMTSAIGDPDLYRLFQNTWPNTVDTTIKWHGVSADDPEEEVGHVHVCSVTSLTSIFSWLS